MLSSGVDLDLEILHQSVVFLHVSTVDFAEIPQKLDGLSCMATLVEDRGKVFNRGIDSF